MYPPPIIYLLVFGAFGAGIVLALILTLSGQRKQQASIAGILFAVLVSIRREFSEVISFGVSLRRHCRSRRF